VGRRARPWEALCLSATSFLACLPTSSSSLCLSCVYYLTLSDSYPFHPTYIDISNARCRCAGTKRACFAAAPFVWMTVYILVA